VLIGLLSGSAASASPLTFYTDETAWLAAVSGFTVGTYPYNVTYTDTSPFADLFIITLV
jgi:hypothetical protein